MLKFIFWILLLANGALFAYHQAYFEGFFSASREPGRLVKQVNADKIQLLPGVSKLDAKAADGAADSTSTSTPKQQETAKDMAGAVVAKPESSDGTALPVAATAIAPLAAVNANAATAASPNSDVEKSENVAKREEVKNLGSDQKIEPEKKPAALACLEIGNFNEADAVRVAARLEALVPSARLSRRVMREVSSHMVFMPPQGSKENADRKVDQLRSLGVTDFYVIQDQSEMRWGISLGVFSSEDAAKKRLLQLQQQGVRTARVGVRNSLSKVAFQLRELDAASRAKLEGFKADFPQQQQRSCN